MISRSSLLGLLVLACASLGMGGASVAQGVSPQQGLSSQQPPPASRCLAIAQEMPADARVQFARHDGRPLPARNAGGAEPRLHLVQDRYQPQTVTIRFAGHATYVIESPEGIRVATDFSGYYGADPLPDAVTMNHAHRTHYTDNPDPAIGHVFRGWSMGPEPAEHYSLVGDVLVRNVPTDIRRGSMMEEGGNSIFIFETADLCIGHLGHLHHPLTDAHYAAIGRLDVVMVPIDGGYTLSTAAMGDVVNRLQSSIVLPMHRFRSTIDGFLSQVAGDYAVEFLEGDSITVSIRDLPRRPTIMIPRNL